MFKAEPRLLFGTPCWKLEVSTPHQGCVCPCSLFAPEPAIGHQGGKMSLQLVQLRRRSAARWPIDVRLNAIAGGASKQRKPHSHFAKQRRDAVSPPVLQVASSAAGRAARPLQPMAVGLPRNDRSLNPRQKLFRFG